MSDTNKYDYFYKAIVFSLLITVGLFVFQSIAVFVMQVLNSGEPISFTQNFQLEHIVVISWVTMLFFVPVSLIFYIVIDKYQLNEIGITGNILKIFMQSILAILIIVVFFTIYILILRNYEYVQLTSRKPTNIFSMLLFGLFSGLAEEIVYRGYLLNLFRKKRKYLIGVIWSSVLFAVLHIFNPDINTIALINIFLVGVFLALVTIFTENLYFAVILHASFNFFDVLLGFNSILTDSNFTWFVVEFLKTNDLITGGKGGITGSIILTVLLILSILVTLFLNSKKNRKMQYFIER